MSAAQRRSGGDLEIVSEVVMAAIPRGDEELRVTFTRGRTSDGKDVAWHSVRIFWQTGDGEWKPGKQGITIRGKELRAVADALAKATSGGTPTPPAPAAPPASSGGPVAPFGRTKGQPLDAIEDDDLKWLESALAASIRDPSKATYLQKNERDLEAVRAELRSRFLQ